MNVIDAHCHLYELSDMLSDIGTEVQRFKEAGGTAMVCAGADLETSRMAVELANKYAEVYATVGIMTNERSHGEQIPNSNEFLKLTNHKKVVAIGECGLNKGDDTELFIFNINLAKETGLPLVVHCRDAFEKVFEVLDYDKVQMHCFTGNEEQMRECVKRGWYISFGGILTFKKSEELRRVASLVPEDKILVETDSPYLAPEPVRGTKNTPANVKYVLNCLAKDNMGQITSENAKRLFGI
ncbi:TatD family hydrolase [Candidatus Amesbacteria bacterium]|nr:TatD family hydrolase [Candidatus Amesbacteria bacterium]